jgi:hypothetical protein
VAASLEQLRPPSPKAPGWATRIAGALEAVRFLYLPLALFALIAVGVHAAADTVDDPILWIVDHLDALFDAAVSHFEWTQGWVHWVDVADRVRIARALALIWELAADAFLAFPILGYREKVPRKGVWSALIGASPRRLRDQVLDVARRPTVMRVSRPLCALFIVLAGATAVGRMVHGTLFLTLVGWLGPGFTGVLTRALGGVVLLAVLFSFGLRAVLGHLRRADAMAVAEIPLHPVKARGRGWVGAAVLIPLAVAALIGAIPIAAFFR